MDSISSSMIHMFQFDEPMPHITNTNDKIECDPLQCLIYILVILVNLL